MKFRVAAIIDTVNVSGPGRQLAAAAQELTRRGHEIVLVLLSRDRSKPRPFETFVQELGINHLVLDERRAFDPRVVRSLDRFVTEFDPHVIQTHSYKGTVAVAALKASGLKPRWVGFFHGATAESSMVRAYHALDRALLRFADVRVVMSSVEQARFSRRRLATRLLYNAVLDSKSATEVAAAVETIEDGVLCVGRLSHEKGVDVLLTAVRQLIDSGRTVNVTIVGDGPARAELEQLTVRLSLTEHVRFSGHTSNPAAFYRSHRLVVIPSRSEGLPNVLLEALACSLPVVATRVGAIPDVLTDVQAGLLVEPEAPNELSRAIGIALDPRFTTEGKDARATIVSRFSLEGRVDALERIYRDLMLENSPR